jgi:hypothetical protein
MSQVVPAKVLNSCFDYRVVEPMPPIFERLSRFLRLKHTPFPVAPRVHNLKGGYRSVI